MFYSAGTISPLRKTALQVRCGWRCSAGKVMVHSFAAGQQQTTLASYPLRRSTLFAYRLTAVYRSDGAQLDGGNAPPFRAVMFVRYV